MGELFNRFKKGVDHSGELVAAMFFAGALYLFFVAIYFGNYEKVGSQLIYSLLLYGLYDYLRKRNKSDYNSLWFGSLFTLILFVVVGFLL